MNIFTDALKERAGFARRGRQGKDSRGLIDDQKMSIFIKDDE